jgi:hypothetical protein
MKAIFQYSTTEVSEERLVDNTSTPARQWSPLFSAFAKAFSTTTHPREVYIKKRSRFILAKKPRLLPCSASCLSAGSVYSQPRHCHQFIQRCKVKVLSVVLGLRTDSGNRQAPSFHSLAMFATVWPIFPHPINRYFFGTVQSVVRSKKQKFFSATQS